MRVKHPTRVTEKLEPGMPLLELDDLRVHYGGIKALKGISLKIDAGEIVAMIGSNGAGKTTTLKTIVRLLPVAGGTLRFCGRDIGGQSTEDMVEAGISLVPEGRAIFPNLSVRENLELGAYLHRDPQAMKETLEDVTGLFPRLGERMSQEGEEIRFSEEDAPGVVFVDTGDQVENRGFSRSVWPNQTEDRFLWDGEAHVVDGAKATEILGDALQLQPMCREHIDTFGLRLGPHARCSMLFFLAKSSRSPRSPSGRMIMRAMSTPA